jgi:hypothetical protein
MLQPVAKIIARAQPWAILYMPQDTGFLRPKKLKINNKSPAGVNNTTVNIVIANTIMVFTNAMKTPFP